MQAEMIKHRTQIKDHKNISENYTGSEAKTLTNYIGCQDSIVIGHTEERKQEAAGESEGSGRVWEKM